jgi:hypothetical protein
MFMSWRKAGSRGRAGGEYGGKGVAVKGFLRLKVFVGDCTGDGFPAGIFQVVREKVFMVDGRSCFWG